MNMETKISIHRKELRFNFVRSCCCPKLLDHACPQFATAYTTCRMLSSVYLARYYVSAHFSHDMAVIVTQKLHGHGLHFLSINTAQPFFKSYLASNRSNSTACVVEA
jgi:hypothetical protein